MICQTAHDWLTQADHPVRLADAPPDVAAHVHACPACQQTMANIARLDRAWRDLPLPAGANSAKAKFLERAFNQPSRQPKRRRWLVPAGVAAAVSLAVLLGVGIGLFTFVATQHDGGDPEVGLYSAPIMAESHSEVVLEKLVNWNLRLTEARDPQERVRLFSEHAEAFKADLNNEKLSDEDRKLGQTLFENGAWLASNEDTLEEADRFAAVADHLLTRIDKAAASNDSRGTQLLLQNYELISARGIDAKLDKVKTPRADQQTKLERIHAREMKRIEMLEQLHTRAAEVSKKELKRVLEQSKKKQRPKNQGKRI